MSVSLSPTQLEKPYHSNHEFYGLYQDRGERFLEKILKKEPFELTDGSSSTISEGSPGVEFLMEKNYKELGGVKKLFCKVGAEWISLSQFKKTEEFGAGTGIGAGTKNTAIQESTQCVFNSLVYNIKQDNIDIEDITEYNISSSYQYCQTTTQLEDIQEFAQSKIWQQSFLTSSNLLYQYNQEENYEHHRDSDFINSLYNSAKKTVNYQLDKWNPSDIWFVKDYVLETEFSSSLDDLNLQVKDMFDKKELIGISLKKVGKEPKIEVKNLDKQNKKQYKYLGYKTTNKSKDISLLFDGGKICFRTFNYGTNWAGEILGKNACHGKIGFGAINSILKKYKLELKTAKEVKQDWEEHEYINRTALLILFREHIEDIDGDLFNIFISEKNIDWRVSKLLGLQLVTKIENQSEEIKNKIITEIVSYASSELDESSVFLKLS